MKLILKPDFFNPLERLKYGALYCANVPGDIAFVENAEMSSICLFNNGTEIGYINEIDRKLLDYYRE